jgi:hypothetical protein
MRGWVVCAVTATQVKLVLQVRKYEYWSTSINGLDVRRKSEGLRGSQCLYYVLRLG